MSEGVGVPRALVVDLEEGAIRQETASAVEVSVGHVRRSVVIERYLEFGNPHIK